MHDIMVWRTEECKRLLRDQIIPVCRGELLPENFWISRQQAEVDVNWQQPIPYGLLVNNVGLVWGYRRTGGDERLQQRHSVGIGGHIERSDLESTESTNTSLATLQIGLEREVYEELCDIPLNCCANAKPIAWIHEHDNQIGNLHIGLVYYLPWDSDFLPTPKAGEALHSLGFMEKREVLQDPNMEDWSKLAIRALEFFDE